MNKVLRIHSADNVLVALTNLQKNETVFLNEPYVVIDNIPAKHKFFSVDLLEGEKVIMYGVTIGTVTRNVCKGERLTVNNIQHAAQPYSFNNKKYNWVPPDVSHFANRTFNGYHRADGQVGTANYWLFIPTVFCENRNLDVIKEALVNELGYGVSEKYKTYTRRIIAGI